MRRPLLLRAAAALALSAVAALPVRAADAPPASAPAVGSPGAPSTPAATAAPPLRVVFQISEADPARWALVLNNVRNLQQEVGAAGATIEIVAYGPGLGMLRAEAPIAGRLAETIGAGVAVLACENTLRAMKLTRDDMSPGIGYVPAGVVEIARRQQQGWSYLRP